MKALSKKHAAIFLNLIKHLGKKECHVFPKRHHADLILTDMGKLDKIYGDAHWYNLEYHSFRFGDHYREPEFLFIVLNEKKNDITIQRVVPCYYGNDAIRTYQTSIDFEPGKKMIVNQALQHEHVKLATEWLEDIEMKKFY